MNTGSRTRVPLMNTHRSTRRGPHVIDPAKVAWTIVLCVALAAIIVAAAPSFAP